MKKDGVYIIPYFNIFNGVSYREVCCGYLCYRVYVSSFCWSISGVGVAMVLIYVLGFNQWNVMKKCDRCKGKRVIYFPILFRETYKHKKIAKIRYRDYGYYLPCDCQVIKNT